jgi:molecular chaperone GrpE
MEGKKRIMKKDKNFKNNEENLVNGDANMEGNISDDAENSNQLKEKLNEYVVQIESLKLQLDEKAKKCDEYMGALQRTAAEFENYKKRTSKEKENLCSDVVSDVVSEFLPVVDNMERAISVSSKDDDKKSLLDGIEMVMRQLKEVMKGLGVEELKSVGEKFDPLLHNAVMHIDDEAFGENMVIEEFQKGYVIKEKVVRHSMVKVAN